MNLSLLTRAATAAALCCASCASPTQKGMVTIQGRGISGMARDGSPMLDTGKYAKKDVPKEFAEGYAQGIADQTWREYWAVQDEQAQAAARRKTPTATGTGTNGDGATHYYRVQMPEGDDGTGVQRVRREAVVPMVEFMDGRTR